MTDESPMSQHPTSFTTPSSPPSPRPSLSCSNSSYTSFANRQGFDRYGDDWGPDALTLLDVVETFFDSRLDLFNRRLKAQSARLKSRAVELLPRGLRTPGGSGILLIEDEDEEESDRREVRGRGEKYKREVEREVERIKVKLAARLTNLSRSWRSAQTVHTKEKVSFLFGVLSLTFSCLLYGMAPEWFPFAYTVQSAFYLPTRIWTYKRKDYHYFLFESSSMISDLCYFVNVLDLLWIWVFPSSTLLFISCYLLTMGPLASAIITWRNSLVFHSLDKVTSLFIHMYPPVVLTVICHVYPDANTRYPGLAGVNEYRWYTMILMSAVPYIAWQATYYKFISIDRKSKIESGERQTSFHYMLNDKRGPIGKALKGIRPEHRELWFIFGQYIYSCVFMLPPATLFVHSPLASAAFLVIIFTVSAWNGACFYVEVFGRKFERELERLRKEMELASATGTSTSSQAPTPSSPSSPFLTSPDNNGDQTDGLTNSPLILPGTRTSGADLKIPDFRLEQPVVELETEGKKTI